MSTWLGRVIWSALCGAAVGMSGCGGSDDKGEPDAQDDTPSDQPADTLADVEEEGTADAIEEQAEDAVTDEIDESEDMVDEEIMNLYGPPT